MVLQGLGQEGLLVAEIEDGDPLRQPGAVGDRRQRGCREAVLDDGIDGRLDQLPPPLGGIFRALAPRPCGRCLGWRSEEHTSELQSLMRISYAVFCLKKKTHPTTTNHT